MNESNKLLVAFERVEDAVTSLQSAFEKHTLEDAAKAKEDRARFTDIETNVDGIIKQVAQHSLLHTQHATMIAAAQDLTLTKVGKDWSERLGKLETNVGEIAAQGVTAKTVLDTIAKYHKHPAVRIAYLLGAAIWGMLTLWLASHK